MAPGVAATLSLRRCPLEGSLSVGAAQAVMSSAIPTALSLCNSIPGLVHKNLKLPIVP
jgi:hypothetical protein